jgi:hypothetical protein
LRKSKPHKQRTRRRALSSGAALACIGLAPLVAQDCTSGNAFAAPTPVAYRSSHHASISDKASLRYVSSPGSLLVEEGSATGGLPGKVVVHLNIGATVKAQFTIYPHGGGSLSGHASGKLKGTGVQASFGGSMEVSSGTGRYAHAHGTGGFYGVLNRNTEALTLKTTGTLTY